MISVDKSPLNFSPLREILTEYYQKRDEIYLKENIESANTHYFFIFGGLLHRIAKLCAIQYAEEVLASENPQKKFLPLLVFRKVGVILFYSYTCLPNFSTPTTQPSSLKYVYRTKI